MIYSMGKPVGVKQSVVKQAVAKQSVVKQAETTKASVTPTPPPKKAVRQCELSADERRLAMIYGRLPFSFSKNWDARLEPPA